MRKTTRHIGPRGRDRQDKPTVYSCPVPLSSYALRDKTGQCPVPSRMSRLSTYPVCSTNRRTRPALLADDQRIKTARACLLPRPPRRLVT